MRIVLNGGLDDPSTDVQSGIGAVPKAVVTQSPSSESIGDLASRVLGYNTRAARDKIRSANATIDGVVRVPIA